MTSSNFTSGDPDSVYPSTSVRNHPFDGPEVFDDTPRLEDTFPADPWPLASQAVEQLRREHIKRRGELGYN